jgi:uncharacterized integral membrane protein
MADGRGGSGKRASPRDRSHPHRPHYATIVDGPSRGPSSSQSKKEVITRTNGNHDDRDDLDPGAGAGARAGKSDLEVGYRKEGVRAGVVALGIVALLLLIFVLQNDEQGPIDFLFWHFKVRIWAALLMAAALGFIGGYLVSWLRRRRRVAREA